MENELDLEQLIAPIRALPAILLAPLDALKATILIILIFLINICFGQTVRVLELKNRSYFSERNMISFKDSTTLVQEVCYDQPNSIDEEYCIILTIVIVDTAKARQLKIIDLNKDTSVIKCVFEWRSVWHWADRKTTITGFIKINSWTKKYFDADLNINVFDEYFNRTYIYNSRRTFLKAKQKSISEWGSR